MRAIVLVAAALVAGGFGLDHAAAQQNQQQQTKAGTEVTGMVTEADEDTGKIVIEDKTYVMPEEAGGASVFPQVGDEVTLYYEEHGGEKVVTRIGQPQ